MTQGTHFKLEGRGPSSLLESRGTLTALLTSLVALAGMVPLGEPSIFEVEVELAKRDLAPFADEGGLTGFVVLSTSHLAIHTWPARFHPDESGLVWVELSSCRPFDLELLAAEVVAKLQLTHAAIFDLSDATFRHGPPALVDDGAPLYRDGHWIAPKPPTPLADLAHNPVAWGSLGEPMEPTPVVPHEPLSLALALAPTGRSIVCEITPAGKNPGAFDPKCGQPAVCRAYLGDEPGDFLCAEHKAEMEREMSAQADGDPDADPDDEPPPALPIELRDLTPDDRQES